MTEEILVTGARGATGRATVEALLRAGAPVRALVRRAETAGLPAGLPAGVSSVVVGDLTRPADLGPALKGVSAMLLLVVAGEDVAEVMAMARRNGVRRVILISSGGVRDNTVAQAEPLSERHARAERAVEDSGLEWVVLRPRWFCRNALWWAGAIQAGRPVRLAYPEAVTAPIHERDIAEVATADLLAESVVSGHHLLTGPQVVSQAEQIMTIAEETELPVRWEGIEPASWRREMVGYGIPPAAVDVLLHQQATLSAEQIHISAWTERRLGRPALTFRDWVRDFRHAFVPGGPQ